ncbi:MAG: VOC family protein [Streptococcus sp.]
MQTIIPHLWFDTQALEAAQLYTSLIPDSRIDWTHQLTDTPSGDAVLLQFQLANLTWLLSARALTSNSTNRPR